MAIARRVSLFEREIRIRLSSSAIDILFDTASVLSEGQVDEGGYYGSTMITVDVGRVGSLVSDSCDAATARRVADLMTGDDRVVAAARRVAVAEGVTRARGTLVDPQIDVRVRAAGAHVHLDVDVEADVAAPQGDN